MLANQANPNTTRCKQNKRLIYIYNKDNIVVSLNQVKKLNV